MTGRTRIRVSGRGFSNAKNNELKTEIERLGTVQRYLKYTKIEEPRKRSNKKFDRKAVEEHVRDQDERIEREVERKKTFRVEFKRPVLRRRPSALFVAHAGT